MKLFVRNLPFSMTDAQLSELFARCGDVVSAKVITDRETGRSRGFGFVEYSSAEAGKKAVAELDGFSVQGRELKVEQAKDPVKTKR